MALYAAYSFGCKTLVFICSVRATEAVGVGSVRFAAKTKVIIVPSFTVHLIRFGFVFVPALRKFWSA